MKRKQRFEEQLYMNVETAQNRKHSLERTLHYSHTRAVQPTPPRAWSLPEGASAPSGCWCVQPNPIQLNQCHQRLTSQKYVF